ncbi:MAG: hypothetical protein M5R40_04950 [Anaerolineae bacterium]|nr:hypothetical protein [Anaerolineae bacterium]
MTGAGMQPPAGDESPHRASQPRHAATPWVFGLVAGMVSAVAGWVRLRREMAHRRRVVTDLTGRIVTLEEAVVRAEAEAGALKSLAEQRRAELSEALAREAEQLALFERLSGLLAQLATLERAVAEGGGAVAAGDVLALLSPLRQAMADMGFTAIGEPGAEVAFDPHLHQEAQSDNLARRALEAGQPVRVQFVGYRRGDHILRRAEVSAILVEDGA